jgi:hypothetical protein
MCLFIKVSFMIIRWYITHVTKGATYLTHYSTYFGVFEVFTTILAHFQEMGV